MSKDEEEISYATDRKGIKRVKIVMLGDQYVGKTSIINRFIANKFDTNHNPTIGIDFLCKNVDLNGKQLRLQLWDTAGQERFRSLIPNYLRDCQVGFIIYDITNQDSFNNVTKWIDFLKENRGDDVLIYIIGNKLDLAQQRQINLEQATQRMKQMGVKYWQTSAKSGQNIDKLFQELCADILKILPQDVFAPLHIHKSKIITQGNDQNLSRSIKKEPPLKLQKQSTKPQNDRRIREKGCC